MKNYKMVLQYEGTRYQGWQKQESSENTIQGKIEHVLGLMCGCKVEVDGSGRTDAGVHALGQVMNVHMNTTLTEQEILSYMNQYLPDDIGIISVEEVPDRFHSRLLAKGKVYRYQVINSTIPHVFERRYAYTYVDELDIEKMRAAVKLLEGKHDFASFTSLKKSKKSTVRTIESIEIVKDKDLLTFTFTGDGFLYHMVRILMGTIIEIGAGVRQPEDITKILASKNREMAGMLVPALGLTLVSVKY